MKVPGQLGRYVAIFVVVPLLLFCAMRKPDSHALTARILVTLAVVFFVYEMLWICGVLDYK